MADSVGEALGDLAVAALQAEGFTFGTPPVAVSVVKRKVPTLPAGKAPVEIVVVVGAQGPSKSLDAARRTATYDLAIVIVAATGHKLRDDPVVRNWIDRIEQRLDDLDRDTFAGMPAGSQLVRADSQGGRLPFDPAALAADLNYVAVPFGVEVEIERATP